MVATLPSERTRLVSVASAGDGGSIRIERVGTASSQLGLSQGAKVPDAKANFACGLAMSISEFERYLPGWGPFSKFATGCEITSGLEIAWDVQLVHSNGTCAVDSNSALAADLVGPAGLPCHLPPRGIIGTG